MGTQVTTDIQDKEAQLIEVVRRLSPERVSQLVDFARLLEFQISEQDVDDLDEQAAETEEDILASEEQWDALCAQPEAKRLMRSMAREALAEYGAGHTTDIAITDDGQLASP